MLEQVYHMEKKSDYYDDHNLSYYFSCYVTFLVIITAQKTTYDG